METKTVVLERTGGPEVLALGRVELAPPGPGEARIRHTAIGLNFIDTYHRSGLYPLPLPSGLGLEAAGVVEALGPNVESVRPGQRVAYVSGPPGSYSEARNVLAERLIPLPDTISDEQAAASLLKGMTAEYLIHRTYAVRPGQTVLFHAAAGGVGSIACQWLRALGVTVIGTVGSRDKAKLAAERGCTHVIVYTEEDFVAKVAELTQGKKLPVVYDSVGRATFLGSLDCLEPRGLYVGFGNASGKPEPFDVTLLAAKGSLYVTRPTLMTYTATRAELLASAEAFFKVVASGAVKVHIGQRFALDDVAGAHRALESRGTIGSSVLIP